MESGNEGKMTKIKEMLIQKLVDETYLNSYFHENVFPERIPLVIVSNGLFEGSESLVKFDREILIHEKKSLVADGKPYLEITQLELSTHSAEIRYIYSPEGVRGSVKFEIIDNDINVIHQELFEM